MQGIKTSPHTSSSTAPKFAASESPSPTNLNLFSSSSQSDAEQGGAQAQFDLGLRYESGLGVTKDPLKAIEFYYLAASQGHTQAQKNLTKQLEKLPQIYGKEKLPLCEASQKGYVVTVECLLKNGANINEKDNYGRQAPLHYASSWGHVAVVEYLIKNGANINEKIDTYLGWTPLHLATLKGHVAVVECLIKNGANVNETSKSGKTALHLANEKGHVAVVECLIKNEAKNKEKKNEDKTVLHAASKKAPLPKQKQNYKDGVSKYKSALESKDPKNKFTLLKEASLYFKTAKDQGYPTEEINKKIIKIGQEFIKIQQYDNALSNFKYLKEDTFEYVYYQVLCYCEQGEAQKAYSLIVKNDVDENIFREKIYQELFNKNDPSQNCNKIIALLIKNKNETINFLLKIINIAVKKQENKSIEVLLEYGLNLNEYDLKDTVKHFIKEKKISTNYEKVLDKCREENDKDALDLINYFINKDYFFNLFLNELFSFNELESGYNKIISVLLKNLEKSEYILLKIFEFAMNNNKHNVIEVFLEYGFNFYKANLTPELKDFIFSVDDVKQYQEIFSLLSYDLLPNYQELLLKSVDDLVQLKKKIIKNNNCILNLFNIQYLEQINCIISLKSFPKKYPIEYARIKPTGDVLYKEENAEDNNLYLYLEEKVILLPKGKNKIEIINTLITTLLYESKRHGFSSEVCKHIHKTITALDKTLEKFTEIKFNDLLYRREIRAHNFFGEDISYDSDSEVEEEIENNDNKEFEELIEEVGIKYFKEGLKKINELDAKNNLRNREDKILPKNNLSERANINYPYTEEEFENIKNDLIILNRHIKNGRSIREAVGKIQTTFLVAQYRGIEYSTSKWNAPSRRKHRTMDETGKPQYSSSVYSTAQFDLYKKFDKDKFQSKEQQTLFKLIADRLQSMLLKMRSTDEFKYNNYSFDNFAECVQDLYSKDYTKFHYELKNENGFLKKYEGEYFLNDENPFVSTGDRPYHALRYSYGIKPYKGNEDKRLRPRWNKSGRAERPYSGKTYISLHELTDYDEKGPMHLVTLADQAKVTVMNNILAERETSFPAYIKEDRVVYTHIAKYPSFSRDYHSNYLEKYGFDEELYDLFKKAFQKYPPHSYENRYLKQILGNWLCAYQEKILIKIALQKSMDKKGVLVYKDKEGLYNFSLPDYGLFNGRDNCKEIKICRESRKK